MSFQFILSGEYQQTLDLDFKRALRDIRSEKGCYVLESFCQNVEVVSYFLYIFLTYIYICKKYRMGRRSFEAGTTESTIT